MKREDFRFLDRLRVRWAEVDLQKIVFNGHYLMYFDTAVAGYWRALALPYEDTMKLLQGDLYVRKATVEYEGSARYDDLLEVGIRCAHVGKSSIRFATAVFRGERRLVQGELIYVFADPGTQTSHPVPASLRAVLQDYEAGQAMFSVRTGGWDAVATEVLAIRRSVFLDEQGTAADLLVDAADGQALHALASNRLAMPLASARLLPCEAGLGQIGRVATLATVRGAGLGRALLDGLMAAARERGDHEVWVNALASAVPFYESAGFRRSGKEFVESGLPHVEMRRAP